VRKPCFQLVDVTFPYSAGTCTCLSFQLQPQPLLTEPSKPYRSCSGSERLLGVLPPYLASSRVRKPSLEKVTRPCLSGKSSQLRVRRVDLLSQRIFRLCVRGLSCSISFPEQLSRTSLPSLWMLDFVPLAALKSGHSLSSF